MSSGLRHSVTKGDIIFEKQYGLRRSVIAPGALKVSPFSVKVDGNWTDVGSGAARDPVRQVTSSYACRLHMELSSYQPAY